MATMVVTELQLQQIISMQSLKVFACFDLEIAHTCHTVSSQVEQIQHLLLSVMANAVTFADLHLEFLDLSMFIICATSARPSDTDYPDKPVSRVPSPLRY